MDNFLINYGILVIDLLLRNEMEVVWQIFDIPNVVLNLLKGDTLDRVGLKHPIYQVLYGGRQVARNIVSTLFDLVK